MLLAVMFDKSNPNPMANPSKIKIKIIVLLLKIFTKPGLLDSEVDCKIEEIAKKLTNRRASNTTPKEINIFIDILK